MAYVAVKGGTKAIEESLKRLRYERIQSTVVASIETVSAAFQRLIDQVMSEASLYAPEVAAIAVKQAEGSPEEAVFLLRAFRSTVPRIRTTREVDPQSMWVERRISAAFKDIPGGQVLGTTTDYSHRLIDFDLADEDVERVRAWIEAYLSEPGDSIDAPSPQGERRFPKVVDYLREQGLLSPCPPSDEEPLDVTKRSLEFPSKRSQRLQILTRGQTGAITALGYASLRGYGALHPTVAEVRVGRIPLFVSAHPDRESNPEDDYFVGEIRLTEVETLVPVERDRGHGEKDLEFEVGYGVCYGRNETKAVAMSLLDQCLEQKDPRYATHDEEFVLLHVDSVEATGFISHLKLPHYVTFQSKLESVRKTRESSSQDRPQ